MSFIGLATVIVFISGKLWPRYESAIWAVFDWVAETPSD